MGIRSDVKKEVETLQKKYFAMDLETLLLQQTRLCPFLEELVRHVGAQLSGVRHDGKTELSALYAELRRLLRPAGLAQCPCLGPPGAVRKRHIDTVICRSSSMYPAVSSSLERWRPVS